MSSVAIFAGKIVLLVIGLAIVLWLLIRAGLLIMLKANGCYGFAAFGFTVFSGVGLLFHKILTGVAAWGAIPWLLAILFGAIPMLLWGLIAIVRSDTGRIRIASMVFLVATMFVPMWVLLEITSG